MFISILKSVLKLFRPLINLFIFVPILRILNVKLSLIPARFGQLISHIDIFLAECDANKINKRIYFMVPVIPYNKFVFDQWKSKDEINIIPHRISVILIRLIDHKLLYRYDCYHQTNEFDLEGILIDSSVNIDITEKNIDYFIKSYGFDIKKEKYVTVAARDNSYHHSIKSVGDLAFTQDFRNINLKNYEKTFSYLNDRGYKVLITGKYENAIRIPNTLFFGNMKREIDDFIVSLFSDFHLSLGGTGYDVCPVTFKKPIIATSRVLPHIWTFYPLEIYNMKHYFSLSKNRYLTLSEICKTYILTDEDIMTNELKLIDPDADEVIELLKEWFLRKTDNYIDDSEIEAYKSDYIKYFPLDTLIVGEVGFEKVHSERPYAILASSYIKKNMQLINPKKVKSIN